MATVKDRRRQLPVPAPGNNAAIWEKNPNNFIWHEPEDEDQFMVCPLQQKPFWEPHTYLEGNFVVDDEADLMELDTTADNASFGQWIDRDGERYIVRLAILAMLYLKQILYEYIAHCSQEDQNLKM